MDVRKYLNKNIKVIIDRKMGSKHPKHGFIYPVNYGFVPNTISGDGEELDCYVLGIYEPVDEFEGECIAIIHRLDDNDDKLIVVPKNRTFSNNEIEVLTEFQERFFKHEIIRNDCYGGKNKMINIEYIENLDDESYKIIDNEFNKFATQNGVTCNYTPFSFVAKENEKIIGILTGHSYYKEIHIGDLIVLEQYRNKHIGSKLIEAVEEYFKDKGFENINLTTYNFQAPEFYKKCGFEVEFVRENKQNAKLDKYFFVKYF